MPVSSALGSSGLERDTKAKAKRNEEDEGGDEISQSSFVVASINSLFSASFSRYWIECDYRYSSSQRSERWKEYQARRDRLYFFQEKEE